MDVTEIEIKQVVSAYSEEIQKNIFEGEWDDLNHQLKLRQQFLEDFFSDFDSASSGSFVKDMINKIQSEDAEFQRIIKIQKQTLEKQHKSIKQGKKAIKVYQRL